MKKCLIILFVLSTIAFAQEDNTVAVYMAGKEPVGAKGAHKMVGGELVKAISKSGKYSAINRTDEILKVIAKEHGYQRSGAVSDEQIKTLGQQLGVQYLCIAEISDVKGGSFYLDVRLVDVVTAKTINAATATSALKNNSEMMAVAQQVAWELVSGWSDTFIDNRDGKTYKKVKIGSQVWMAENLNYAAGGSKCYGEGGKVITEWDGEGVITERDEEFYPIATKTLTDKEIQANCTRYGRLYNWFTAKKACPAGWHLPSDAEWTTLTDYVRGRPTAESKSFVELANERRKTDEYGFSALPGGYGNNHGNFRSADNRGSWWSATERDASLAYSRDANINIKYADRYGSGKSFLFSVRCVQD